MDEILFISCSKKGEIKDNYFQIYYPFCYKRNQVVTRRVDDSRGENNKTAPSN